VEPPPTAQDEFDRASAEIGDRLDVIEAAVHAGSTDLAQTGFWRLVGRIKRDRALIVAHADQVGRIDRKAFLTWGGWLRLPSWAGTMLGLVGALVGLAAAIGATLVDDEVWAGVLLLGAGAIWTAAFHIPSHHLVGWLVGIRFTDFFLRAPFPPLPGIKTNYATYLRADPSSRAWMHASGAIATKLAPFIALAWSPFTVAPRWAPAGLVALGVLLILFDVVFSVQVSDWKKFRRERAVARSNRSPR
jgi:hypothetical protein